MTSSSIRSRAETKSRLLSAARIRFRDHGFDGTSVRSIASDAGVDAALVIRYFGSKEGLFTEIVLADVAFDEFLAGDRSTLGRRLAAWLATKDHSPGMETMMRSLGNDGISLRYEEELHQRYVVPLAAWLHGRDAEVRAGLIVSILNGIAVSQAVLQQRSVTSARPSAFTRQLGASLQALVDGVSMVAQPS